MDILQIKKSWSRLLRFDLDYWSKVLVLFYVFSMPFVSAYSFSDTISFPLIFSVFLFFLMSFRVLMSFRLPPKLIGLDIITLLFLFFISVLSYLFNGQGNAKALNHTVAYLSTFTLFYITIKFTLFQFSNKKELFIGLLQAVCYTTLLSAFFANVEFISTNFLGFELNEHIYRPTDDQRLYNPLVIGLFIRARGFASESGAFTQMMELFVPLTIYYMYFSGYCKWQKWLKGGFVVMIVFSFLFAASSASFIIIPSVTGVAIVLYIRKVVKYFAKKTAIFFLKAAIFLMLAIAIGNYFSIYANVLLSITSKADSTSFDDRKERNDLFFSKFTSLDVNRQMIGIGPAGLYVLRYDSKSILSFYYNITLELGIIGLALLAVFLAYCLFSIYFIPSTLGFFLCISFISGMLHYHVNSNFWVPWYWFICVFIVFCQKNKKEIFVANK